MTICYFGIYNPDFGRNKVYMAGLRALGVEIVECRDTSPGLIKYWRLFKKHRAIVKGDAKNGIAGGYDALIVGYPGHIFVPLAKLISRKMVIADLLGSLYDAEKHSHMSGRTTLWKAKIADRLAVRFADKVLLESRAQRSFFEAQFGQSDKYAVVYTGVDEGVFSSLERGGGPVFPLKAAPSDMFRVFFRGKLTPECGIEYILNAAEILKKDARISFTVIGRGYLLETVEKMMREKKLDNVELITRYLTDEEMRKAVSRASLYLGQFEDNHRLKRTIPHKAFEAFVAGIPYLSEDAPAIKELVKEGETGFLVPMADPQMIAEKISLLSRDPELMKRVAHNARKFYESELSAVKLARRIVDLVRE